MTRRSMLGGAMLVLLGWVQVGEAGPPARPADCKRAVIEGELGAGQGFSQAIGGGLKVFFQPIASGWILRVVPAAGPMGEHDYAELATPPYRSVTPLSISTDFAFRAQDAVGWNPRRFRFATSAASFARLERMYERLMAAGTAPPPALEEELASEIGQAAEGTFTILDAKLAPGMADQWSAAAAVASHFTSTAHTLVQEPASPLGRLVWLRFRLDLDLPHGFAAGSGLRVEPRVCKSSQ
jgi:hypothetical protein